MSLAGTGSALSGLQWIRGQASKSLSTSQQSEWVDILSTIGQNRSTTSSAPSAGSTTVVQASGTPAIVSSTYSSNGNVYILTSTGALYSMTNGTVNNSGVPIITTGATGLPAASLLGSLIAAPNGKLYGLPAGGDATPVVVVFDPVALTATQITDSYIGYQGGTLGANGNIYMYPTTTTTSPGII